MKRSRLIIERFRHPHYGYAAAVLLAAAAQVARLPLNSTTLIPFITFVPFILLSAFLGGLGPGLLTTLLCTAEAIYFCLTPTGSFGVKEPQELLGAAALALSGVTASLLFNQLHRTREQLTRLADIVQSSDDAVIGKTPEGIVTSWNPGAERIYGYTEKEMIGGAVEKLVRPRPLMNFREFWRESDAAKRCSILRLPVCAKTEIEFSFSITTSPIRDSAGVIVGTSTIGRDVTERKRAEAEIRELNVTLEQRIAERTAELKAANQELEAFSYSVSHDLRAPLRAMDGFCQVLLEDYAEALDSQGMDYLMRVRAASQRMDDLVDGILELSRAGRSSIRRTSVNLDGLSQAIAVELQKSNPAHPVEFVSAPGLVVEADANLMRIVLENLLGNAWKFTSKHQRARVELGRRQWSDETAYFVRDDGAGFEMAYVDKLFGAFQRLHSLAEFEGTGIGLANVQRIIHRHGGRVWAEGEVEKGATFYFTLPSNAK